MSDSKGTKRGHNPIVADSSEDETGPLKRARPKGLRMSSAAGAATSWTAPPHIQIASVDLVEDAEMISDPNMRDIAIAFNEIIMYCRQKSKHLPKPSGTASDFKRCPTCKHVMKPNASACIHCFMSASPASD